MIINTRQDLDAAPSDVRDRFVSSLAAGINSLSWVDGQWALQQNTATIERFGFTLADFPDAPVPDMPHYNPDERAAEQELAEAKASRAAAYTAEADPLFFKWQAGEGTEEAWRAKREEIRARYPYPEE